MEDLNLKGMSKRAKAKRDEVTGKWLRNGAAQKSGINKALANAGSGISRSTPSRPFASSECPSRKARTEGL
jgi:hypothetical protein